MLTVVGRAASRTRRVYWCLEELGLPYERIEAAPRSEEARAYNPLGKIPSLLDGDAVLTDSVAIMTWLADREGRLTMPAGGHERARQDAATNFAQMEMDATLWSFARHKFLLPEETRSPAARDLAFADWRTATERFRHFLEGPFVMGETFTIADIMAVHCAGFAEGFGFDLGADHFASYVARVRERPAFQRVAAL